MKEFSFKINDNVSAFLKSLGDALCNTEKHVINLLRYSPYGKIQSISVDTICVCSESAEKAEVLSDIAIGTLGQEADQWYRNKYSWMGDYHYEVEYDPKTVKLLPFEEYNYEMTIVRLFKSEEGEKLIQYYGFGYLADSPKETPYRFVSYMWFVAPLSKALAYVDESRDDEYGKGLYGFEVEEGQYYEQVTEDCNSRRLCEIYSTYDNGNAPKRINVNEVNENTPDGVYILKK